MTRNRLQIISGVSAAAIMLLSCSARSEGQEIDFEYRCVILDALSSTDQTTMPPESVAEVYVGDTFYVEFWATDSGTTNMGLVSVYADLDYPETYAAIAADPSCSSLFGIPMFCSGTDDGSMIDELGGSQLAGGVGIEPEWARVAYVEFTAATTGLAGFLLEPAQGESSAYNRGLILPSAIEYGSCDVVSRERGACCGQGTCTDGTTEDECLTSGGSYAGDASVCGGDPDGDGVADVCDNCPDDDNPGQDDDDRDGLGNLCDVCPSTTAPGGVDSEGRPLGDLDGDCDVDLADFDTMQENFSGPSD